MASNERCAVRSSPVISLFSKFPADVPDNLTCTTGIAPCKLFLQQDMCIDFDSLRPDCEVCEKQTKQVAHHLTEAKMRQFHIGQKVMVKDMHHTDTKWSCYQANWTSLLLGEG